MKKTILISLLCMLCGSTVFSATVQRTILSHKGKLTQYDANHWTEAITDAVAGDTIYFTSGVFHVPSGGAACGDLVVDKPITLIGAGVGEADGADRYKSICTTGTSTTFFANLIIAISGSPTLNSTFFEGFYLPDGAAIGVTQPVTNLVIKRCQFNGGYGGGSFAASATVTNVTLEDCSMGWFSCANLVNPDIHNCFIGTILGEGLENLSFTNCTIGEIRDLANCTFLNCCLGSGLGINTYVHCVYSTWDTGVSTLTNCWRDENCYNMSADQYETAGYLGNDGTVVGPLGGQAPFTLVPSRPYVSSSSIVYNKSTKKLNVNVTVKKGQ